MSQQHEIKVRFSHAARKHTEKREIWSNMLIVNTEEGRAGAFNGGHMTLCYKNQQQMAVTIITSSLKYKTRLHHNAG